MAFLKIQNVHIAGISAAVPREIEKNEDLPWFKNDPSALSFFIERVGVRERRVSRKRNVCSSDLCFSAAEKIIDALRWRREEIEAVVFVSQTPDYRLPATACLLQQRLKLPSSCLAFDISLGCSGWVYGMSVLASIMGNGNIKKALLLVGDTPGTHLHSILDKSSAPLFGDAGTATALEVSEEAAPMFFNLETDGAGAQAIIIPEGGARVPFSKSALNYEDFGNEVKCTPLQTRMNGLDVFSFAISRAPQSIDNLLSHFLISKQSVDFLLLHQANHLINDKIRKRTGFSQEQCPSHLISFGNTSCASIPLLLVSENDKNLWGRGYKKNILACGFGVGLSIASLYTELSEKTTFPPLVEI